MFWNGDGCFEGWGGKRVKGGERGGEEGNRMDPANHICIGTQKYLTPGRGVLIKAAPHEVVPISRVSKSGTLCPFSKGYG